MCSIFKLEMNLSVVKKNYTQCHIGACYSYPISSLHAPCVSSCPTPLIHFLPALYSLSFLPPTQFQFMWVMTDSSTKGATLQAFVCLHAPLMIGGLALQLEPMQERRSFHDCHQCTPIFSLSFKTVNPSLFTGTSIFYPLP